MIRVKKQLLSAVVLSLVLLGCSNKNNPSETTTSPSTSTQTTKTTTTDTTTTAKTTSSSTEASSEGSSTKDIATEKQQSSQGSGMADVSLGYQMVVNKKHALPSTYAPGEDPTAGAQVKKLIQKMQELDKQLLALPLVKNVVSLTTTTHIEAAGDSIVSGKLVPEHLTGSPEELNTITERLRSLDTYNRSLVSDDLKATQTIIFLMILTPILKIQQHLKWLQLIA